MASFLGTRSGVPSELTAALGALAIFTPFVLLREFARRVELARLRISVALLVDILSGALQVLMLFVLIHWERLRTDTAYLAVGASCVLPALAWLFLAFRGDKFCAQSAAHELLRSWRVAKWSFLAQMVGLLHWQGVVWIIVWQLGAGATGVLAAANYVILLLNPLALGVCNYISPLAVNAYFQHGLGRVRSLIAMAMAAMGVIIATFSVAVYFYSDLILTGLFTSSDYQGYGTLMLALGLNMMLGVMHMMNDQGVWAIERPEWLLRSTMIAVGVTLLLSLPMVHQYGLLGGAWSMLIGRFVGLTYQTILFFCTSIEPRVFGEPRRQGEILG
ncbi:MAG: polysaccharide biosynthesis C-terminal domain-containing protein [Planctomycetota bacterium]|nr:polysaccharide biosynthesis C-terminal domain-containing protein [Planctomycetota bacterium]